MIILMFSASKSWQIFKDSNRCKRHFFFFTFYFFHSLVISFLAFPLYLFITEYISSTCMPFNTQPLQLMTFLNFLFLCRQTSFIVNNIYYYIVYLFPLIFIYFIHKACSTISVKLACCSRKV